MNSHYTQANKAFRYLIVVIIFSLIPLLTNAQCNNWNINVVNIQPSNCAASGSFKVNLSGANIGNLTNIKYSIPLNGSGFSVPPNNSPDFVNIPSGSYTVKVEATCNGAATSKTASVTIGGSYTSPTMFTQEIRGSLNCGSYGQIQLTMTGSSTPYTIKILSAPGAYTASTTFTTSASSYLLDNLPAGDYTLQVVDTCGTATPTQTVTVTSLVPSALPLSTNQPYGTSNTCNIVNILLPGIIGYNNPDWAGYSNSSLYEVACSIDGGTTVTPYKPINGGNFTITLPGSETYKDVYGQSIIYYIKPPCGSTFQINGSFPYPYLNLISIPHCNNGFSESIQIMNSDLVCFPVTLTISDGATTHNYTMNAGNFTTPALPYGNYSLTYTTADGYSGGAAFSNVSSSNPYSVYVQPDASGLNGYIMGFNFTTANGSFMNGTQFDLVSSPAGYAYSAILTGNAPTFLANVNLAPNANNPGSNTQYFKPGNYTWKITDSCGSYLLPVTVVDSQTFHYTLDVSDQKQTCNGLEVYPTGTATYLNMPASVAFQILETPAGYYGPAINPGDYFTLTVPGTYIIGISSSNLVNIYGSYPYMFPNPYQVTQTIVYNPQPLAVDINNTQGFLCIGASSSQGQIVIAGTGGVPFHTPTSHYQYYLAAQGNGLNGPYIDSNTTGIFSSLGNAGSIYDLKIKDSCGAYAVQPVKILDLSTAILATASADTLCAGEQLQLTAIPMPAASYAWTGPNGFSSVSRTPVINNISLNDTGIYTVTITTPFCSVPASYQLHISVKPSPSAAAIQVSCTDTSAILIGSNVPWVSYEWYRNNYPIPGATNPEYTVDSPGVYRVYTIYDSSGCKTPSDSVVFSALPSQTAAPNISATAAYVCPGDSVLLTAVPSTPVLTYQWFKNGIAINNATDSIYMASDSGKYILQITTGPCTTVYSDTFTLAMPVPYAAITPLSATTFCDGDSVILTTANKDSGLTYMWQHNNDLIQGATDSSYTAMEGGKYTLTVNNGLCSAIAPPVFVTVNPLPVANINTSGNVTICQRDSLLLSTPDNSSYTYTWLLNGSLISGATGSSYTATKSGNYSVTVSNGLCPDSTSATVSLTVIPRPDTSITANGPTRFCDGGSVTLNAAVDNNYNYIWLQNGQLLSNTDNYQYVVTTAGYYNAIISNHVCADTTRAISVLVDPLPVPVIHRMDALLSTDTFSTYQWYMNGQLIPDATSQTYIMTQTGYYTVAVTDSNGCIGMSDSLFVASLKEACIVRLPSAFSPNGDGHNDVFRLIGEYQFSLYEFKILNRWGQTVFETADMHNGWNGKLGGVDQPIGTYFYFIKYKCDAGSAVMEQKGDLTLIR